LQILTDGSYSVVTKSPICKGTQFGPFQAGKVQTLDPTVAFPLKIFSFDGNSEYYLDISDENKCSWLIFVSPADHLEEQNLVCYQSLKSHLKIVHKSSFATSQPKPTKNCESTSKVLCKDVALGGPLLNDMFTDSSDLQQADLNQFELNIDNQNLLLDADNLIEENLLNENVKDLDHFNFEIDDSQKQFVCDICLKQFTKVKLLIIHLRHHTGDFVCFKCLKIFCRRENLKSHICNVNSRHSCSLCDKSFTQRKYLSRHLEAMHNKKFSCVSCNKSYYSNKELLEHNCSKIPLVEKEKFLCPICDKLFYRDTYLRKHLKTHVQRSKTVKFPGVVCEVCGLSLETKNSYYLHKKNHEEPAYSCEICKKKFYRQDSLKQHILGHQKTPEIECNVCKKKFKTKKILMSHMKYHNNDKLHKCPLCDASFKQRANLNRHLKGSHKENKSKCVVIEYYNCPICAKSIKLRSSLLRHLRKVHSDISNVDLSCLKPKLFTNSGHSRVNENNNEEKAAPSDNLCDNLMSNSLEFDDQINNLLNSAENNSAIHKQAVDNLVKELDLGTKKELKQQREVCLSIPDLTEADQEITLDKNAYILENGTIVQPQGDSDNVIIYVLDQAYS
ncbi:PR domain zinc finger protein 15-like, partial [Asbolus verrucosus]